jgi:hypothetical protein
MNQQQSTARPTRPWSQRYSPGQVLATTLMAAMGLLAAGSLGLSTGLIAFRTRDIPPFDWRLSADKQLSLAVHYGPVCRQLPGIPEGSCGDYVPDMYEFDISYATPHTQQQWVSALVPIR